MQRPLAWPGIVANHAPAVGTECIWSPRGPPDPETGYAATHWLRSSCVSATIRGTGAGVAITVTTSPIYLDPAAADDAAPAAAAATGGGGTVVLNRGKGIRPSGDARGWKWRDELLAKRDASLLYASENTVARTVERS